ncbi:MAG: sulfatase-like hydrolase/transferase [Acidimicrobiia bacterium]|nr:sulfatase-like hydrolase/transferase [Acidimicrobiia bacterium]
MSTKQRSATSSSATESAPSTAAQPTPLRREFQAILELTALSSLAVAQPVLDLYGRNAAVLVSERVTATDLVVVALLFVLVPPTVAWGIEALVGIVSRRARLVLHVGLLAGFAAVFGAQVASEVLGDGTTFVVLGALIAATATAAAVTETQWASTFLRYLAVTPVALLVMLLVVSPASRTVFATAELPPGEILVDDPAPVVVIVLDELPTMSLLDGEGAIDADLYPHLAAFADDATWYRNNTTVAPNTVAALPAILTGAMPRSDDELPIAADHPRNLFTLLAQSHDLHVVEAVTELCPRSLCERRAGPGDTGSPIAALVRLAPRAWDGLTGIPATDRPTGEDAPLDPVEEASNDDESSWLADDFDFFLELDAATADPAGTFAAWTDQFASNGDRPPLHYLHILLPHQDWTHLPDGRRYRAPNPPAGLWFNEISDDPDAAERVRQRHLLQVAYTDVLLGQAFEELRRADLYDDALIIVTADHGVSFRPGDSLRPLSATNAADILWAPLLVKEPHQQEGRVVDHPVATIDIVPTVADILGVRHDWSFDGRSLRGEPRDVNEPRRSFAWHVDLIEPGDDGFHEIDGVAEFAAVLEAAASRWPSGDDLRLYRIGSHPDLVGRPLDEFTIDPTSMASVRVELPDGWDSTDLDDAWLPVYLEGWVDGPVEAAVVVVNGRVAAAMSVNEGLLPPLRPFDLIVPPQFLRSGSNEVSVFTFDPAEPGVLHPTTAAQL